MPDALQPTAAPRAAAALAWTRELMCAAEAPLVPPSKYAGGALVVNDASGQAQQLSLRKYHVDVHIEDGFARTTIDQIYFNHTWQRLQGTFHFPLPPDASLSRLAMYVNGQLMEGGMAERDFARQTFDTIVRKMQDPALLEWVDGSTFKMRVFPLDPRQEKRIILSYTQRLPVQYGRTPYRFPAGHSLETVRDWSFHAARQERQVDDLVQRHPPRPAPGHDREGRPAPRCGAAQRQGRRRRGDRPVRWRPCSPRTTGEGGQAFRSQRPSIHRPVR